jgi:arabinan endo-1,5-alpha-L-arabinosidase
MPLNAVEAPFIIRHRDWYYLFATFDFCCQGFKSTYRTVVGRLRSITVFRGRLSTVSPNGAR